jgi:hypothetical protein
VEIFNLCIVVSFGQLLDKNLCGCFISWIVGCSVGCTVRLVNRPVRQCVSQYVITLVVTCSTALCEIAEVIQSNEKSL